VPVGLHSFQVESCGIPPFAKNAKDGAPIILLQPDIPILSCASCVFNGHGKSYQSRPRTRSIWTQGVGECPDPYTMRYADLNKYVAAALSVPKYFESLTADSRPDLCGKPSGSWRIVSSDLWKLLVNPSGLMKSISLPFSSSLNARDGGQLQVEFLHQRMTHRAAFLQAILTGRE
jgi:hypothetical protein